MQKVNEKWQNLVLELRNSWTDSC